MLRKKEKEKSRGRERGRRGGGKNEIISILREIRKHCIHETKIGL